MHILSMSILFLRFARLLRREDDPVHLWSRCGFDLVVLPSGRVRVLVVPRVRAVGMSYSSSL